jgi:hypothetical protein
VLGVWQRTAKRRVPLAIAVFSALLLPLLIGGGWYYHHCSKLIDAQLQGGPFRNSVNI